MQTIKNKDYRYDSFNNGKVMSFLEGKKKGLPAMGWNSWNAFGSSNTEELSKIMADDFIRLGLDKLGYKYIVLDDGCYKPARVDGKLSNEPEKFPDDFKVLSDYIHSKGLKFGMYNDIGTNLCAGAAVGTCGHEKEDAASYVNWGVDFLKVDNCYYLWDNATFSNPKNARFVYAPNIQKIHIEGPLNNGNSSLVSQSFYAATEGEITGSGPFVKNCFVTNIGTFDGTGPDQTPTGDESGELRFYVTVPKDGEYMLSVTYATGEEVGQGAWLQVALGDELFYDDFLPVSGGKNTTATYPFIKVKMQAGKNVIRLMNHRRQENTLSSYAKLLEEINLIKPDNDLVFSTCEWGKTQPQDWAYKIANSWRILNDITFWVGSPGNAGKAAWVDGYTPSVTSQYNKAVIMDEFAGLDKGWNDPDMLVVGMDGLNEEQNKTHFAMWCMMNSPLMLGMDLRRVEKGDWIHRIIANEKLIALNQDLLGVQAKRVKSVWKEDGKIQNLSSPDTNYCRNNERLDILAKPLYDGSIAVSFFNLSQTETYENISISMKEIMDAVGYKMPLRPDYVNSQKILTENLWTGEKGEITWTKDDMAEGVSVKCGKLGPCESLVLRIKTLEPLNRKTAAKTVHEYLLNTMAEADDEDWKKAEVLEDLYDCRTCAAHIAQVYVKGIMDGTACGSVENASGKIVFEGSKQVSEEEAASIIDRLFNHEKRLK
ncbi:MAG: hypothetical protein MJ176_05890 [Treponema sp.]|nr:hypothetical protein [Treponema sp.]